jgi:CubicO group peptidase (beta-lactamase class C family)
MALIDALASAMREAAVRHLVPGFALAVHEAGRVATVEWGLADAAEGRPVTRDTVFALGSISKAVTATLAMTLVRDGLLDVERPVLTYLPGVAIDPRIRVVDLMCHTSGLEWELDRIYGEGADCLARLAGGFQARGVVEPGETFSYCNAGFLLLARIVEVAGGDHWEALLRERLLRPLGAHVTVPSARRSAGAAAAPVARGHVPAPDGSGRQIVAPEWALPRVMGPTGGVWASARGLARFAGAHLGDGPPGLLPAELLAAMRATRVRCRFASWAHGWSLVWGVLTPDGRLLGYDGQFLGHISCVRLLPEHRVAIALLTNGPGGKHLYRETLDGFIADELGVVRPATLAAPERPPDADLAAYAGRYARSDYEVLVEPAGCGLAVTGRHLTRAPNGWAAYDRLPIRMVRDGAFVYEPEPGTVDEDLVDPIEVHFEGSDERGRPKYAHLFSTAHRRSD